MKTKKKTNPTGKRKKNPEKANWNKSKAESDKPGRDGPARQPSCGRLYLYIPLIPARGERENCWLAVEIDQPKPPHKFLPLNSA